MTVAAGRRRAPARAGSDHREEPRRSTATRDRSPPTAADDPDLPEQRRGRHRTTSRSSPTSPWRRACSTGEDVPGVERDLRRSRRWTPAPTTSTATCIPTMNGAVKVGKAGGWAAVERRRRRARAARRPPGARRRRAAEVRRRRAAAEASISASALAFDHDDALVPGRPPVALTFDNQDAGVPHNVAIYRRPAYTQPQFNGEIVTGADDRHLRRAAAGRRHLLLQVRRAPHHGRHGQRHASSARRC